MSEMWASGAISDGPDALGRGLQTLVHLHIAAVGCPHSRLFEADAARIWRAPSGYQKVRAFQRKFVSVARAEQPDPLARVALDEAYFCLRHDGDTFVPAHFFQSLRDIFVFVVSEAAIAVDQRHLGAETAEGLGEFESDITSAQDQEMFRDVIKFQGLDVGKRLRLGQSRNWLKRGARAGVDDDILAAKRALPAVGQLGFDGLGANEAPCPHYQFRAALLVVVEMNVDQAPHHLALALTHGCHVDANILFADAELVAAIKEGSNLGAVDDVITGQASDVRARAAYILALDHNHALSLLCGGPGNKLAADAAAQHEEIVFFR